MVNLTRPKFLRLKIMYNATTLIHRGQTREICEANRQSKLKLFCWARTVLLVEFSPNTMFTISLSEGTDQIFF